MKLGMMTPWTLGNKSRTRPILTLTSVTWKSKMAAKILTFYPLTPLIFGRRAWNPISKFLCEWLQIKWAIAGSSSSNRRPDMAVTKMGHFHTCLHREWLKKRMPQNCKIKIKILIFNYCIMELISKTNNWLYKNVGACIQIKGYSFWM